MEKIRRWTIPNQITDWLSKHDKGDLHECTFEELKQAFAAAGIKCGICEYEEVK